MARPPKLTIDYFPHYADRTDETLLRIVEREYGNDGYAFWFKLRERLCNQSELFLSRNNVTEWEFLLTITRLSEASVDNMIDLLAKIDVVDAELWHKWRIVWIQRLADDVADVYVRRKAPPPTRPRPRQKETGKGCCDINVSADEFVLTETHLREIIGDEIPPETGRSGVIDSISTQTKLNQIKQKQTTTTGSVDDSNMLLTRITTILGTDVARRCVTEHGLDYCAAQLAYMDRQAGIRDPRTWLPAALKGNYAKFQPPAPRPDPNCPHCSGRGAVTNFTNNTTHACACIPRPASSQQPPAPQQAPDPNRRDTAALAARVAAARTP